MQGLTSVAPEESAALKAANKKMAAMEAKMKEMEAQTEAATKVMDYHETQQLTSHLQVLQQQQTPQQSVKYTMDLAFGTSKDALSLALFLGMSEEYARKVDTNGEKMMELEIQRLHTEGKLPGDPWNYFSRSRGEVLEHWNYVVNEKSSQKKYSNGIRDQGRKPTNLEGFMRKPEAEKAKLSRAQVIALRLYTTLMYKYVNAPLRDKKYYRTYTDQSEPRHPLAAVVWYIFKGLKQLRNVADMKQGEKIVLWRGMKNVSSIPATFMQSGGAEQAPMSTSRDMQVALNYGTDGKSMKDSVLFKIVARNDLEMGADLQWLSAFPQEAEVLYPPLAFLKPEKKEVLQSSGITLIEMTANLSSGLGLVSGPEMSDKERADILEIQNAQDAGFSVGTTVRVFVESSLKDGKIINISNADGITVKYGRNETDYYVLKKLIQLVKAGEDEDARLKKVKEDEEKRLKKENEDRIKYKQSEEYRQKRASQRQERAEERRECRNSCCERLSECLNGCCYMMFSAVYVLSPIVYGLLAFSTAILVGIAPYWLTPTAAIIADNGNDDPRKSLLRQEVFNFVLARGICLLSWSACTVLLQLGLLIRSDVKNGLDNDMKGYVGASCAWLVPAVLFGLLDVATAGGGAYVWFAFSGVVHVIVFFPCGLLGTVLVGNE